MKSGFKTSEFFLIIILFIYGGVGAWYFEGYTPVAAVLSLGWAVGKYAASRSSRKNNHAHLPLSKR